jgi:predicted site-specific integrase-resolvase
MGNVYRIGEFAEKIGRSSSTVRRWEAEGKMSPRRSPSGQRFFTDTDVHEVLTPVFDRTDRETVVYCRVSSANQRTDLASQREAMQQFCLARGLPVERWITEVGGMILTRPKLLTKQEMVQDLLAIVHTFSCRLYGLRRYEKSLKSDDLTGGPA